MISLLNSKNVLQKLLHLCRDIPQNLIQLYATFLIDIIISHTVPKELLSQLTDSDTSDLLVEGITVFIFLYFTGTRNIYNVEQQRTLPFDRSPPLQPSCYTITIRLFISIYYSEFKPV